MKKLGYNILVNGVVVVRQTWEEKDIEHETIVEQFDSDLQCIDSDLQYYIDEDEDEDGPGKF